MAKESSSKPINYSMKVCLPMEKCMEKESKYPQMAISSKAILVTGRSMVKVPIPGGTEMLIKANLTRDHLKVKESKLSPVVTATKATLQTIVFMDKEHTRLLMETTSNVSIKMARQMERELKSLDLVQDLKACL
eukprot:CAMPEP_0116873406 /NCGR_PEP_ID=MMETSP0463-20121206/4494_1 /TAXON_ID=181622 /ORGANISM="Strombidinopsis sp, Strain SopsisLIS2011" /LENGTH=133 /DNA_ID=CAMNT_0004515271 /DNA_START=303 /DNA_END=704 /DNA_ORIENTATION=+